MVLTEGKLEFDFSNAIQAFKFDEVDKTSSHYHGATHFGMKSVDLNDDALILTIMHRLKQKLPIGLKPVRWQNELLRSVVVVNMAKWNVHFPEWPVVRVS